MRYANVERFGPGADATEFVAGDFILTHRHRLFARLIRLAQKRRFKGLTRSSKRYRRAVCCATSTRR